MSNRLSHFSYALSNALHVDIKGRKRNLSDPASDLQGHDLKVAVEAAARLTDLRRPTRIAGSKRVQRGAKSGAISKELRGSDAPKIAAQVSALTTRNYAGLRPAMF
jgi:hypothetical protein